MNKLLKDIYLKRLVECSKSKSSLIVLISTVDNMKQTPYTSHSLKFKKFITQF